MSLITALPYSADKRARSAQQSDYWHETRTPFMCLIFLLPLLAIYEWGVSSYGGNRPEMIRNGADFWMRQWIEQAGRWVEQFGWGIAEIGWAYNFLLPGLVVLGLLGWQMAGRYSWKISGELFIGMLAESLLFAFLLVVIGQVLDLAFQEIPLIVSIPFSVSSGGSAEAALAITFVGAGIYEEVMFRLCLLPLCFGGLRLLQMPAKYAAFLAILGSSLLFSVAHYIGPAAESFELFTFTFRTLAGLFFAMLFVTRGFGITVGCHAAYDLLVGILL